MGVIEMFENTAAPQKRLKWAMQALHDIRKRLHEHGCCNVLDLTDIEFDIGTVIIQLKLAELDLKWRGVDEVPPPKDGSIIVLEVGDGNYALVRWLLNNELTDGGWFLVHGGPEGFLFDDELSGMRWRPFVP